MDESAAALRRSHLAQLAGGLALGVVLRPGEAVSPDLDVQLLRESVDAAYAHAVQTAGDLVVGSIELAAGVQLGEDNLDRGHLLAVGDHVVHRDAAAVVDDGDGVVHVDGDVDASGVPTQRLVHRIIHDLVDQVVQAHLAGRADVHRRPQANRRQALQHGDIFTCVAAARLRRGRLDSWDRLYLLKDSFRADCGRCHAHSMRPGAAANSGSWARVPGPARHSCKRRAKSAFSAFIRASFFI